MSGPMLPGADDTHLVDAQIPEAVAHVHFLPARWVLLRATPYADHRGGETPLTEDPPGPSIFPSNVRSNRAATDPPGNTRGVRWTTRGEVVEWARDIYDDLDFTVVRRWLDEHPHGRPAATSRCTRRARCCTPRVSPGGHPRRRRPAGDHPRRRLLPVVHLPPAALGHRTGPVGTSRHALGGALPVDLRRDPQPVGDVEAALPDVYYVRYIDAADPRPGGRDRILGRRSAAAAARRLGRGVSGHRATDEDLRHSIALHNEGARDDPCVFTRAGGATGPDVPTEEPPPSSGPPRAFRPRSSFARARQYRRRRGDPCGRATTAAWWSSGRSARQPPLGLITSIERAGCLHRGRRLCSAIASSRMTCRRTATRFAPWARGLHPQRYGIVGALRNRPDGQAQPDEELGCCRRRRDHLRHAELLRSGAARPADAPAPAPRRPAFRASRSSTRRTPGSSSSFANRRGPSPTPIMLGGPPDGRRDSRTA